jgi:nucleoside-diphosphate-sugar epimerase
MARTALIIGGSGQIGQAVAIRLLADGWNVIAAQQHPLGLPTDLVAAGVRPVALDRDAPGAVARAVVGGVDALIDTVAFDETHARQLLEIQGDVGAMVVISSGSVYCDRQGRTLDEAKPGGFPDFPIPICEDQPTVSPSDANYSTRTRSSMAAAPFPLPGTARAASTPARPPTSPNSSPSAWRRPPRGSSTPPTPRR